MHIICVYAFYSVYNCKPYVYSRPYASYKGSDLEYKDYGPNRCNVTYYHESWFKGSCFADVEVLYNYTNPDGSETICKNRTHVNPNRLGAGYMRLAKCKDYVYEIGKTINCNTAESRCDETFICIYNSTLVQSP
eukprot:UN15841